jgi:hypothetical protein
MSGLVSVCEVSLLNQGELNHLMDCNLLIFLAARKRFSLCPLRNYSSPVLSETVLLLSSQKLFLPCSFRNYYSPVLSTNQCVMDDSPLVLS